MIKNVILFFFLPSNLHKENLKKKADVMMAPDVVEEVQQHIYSSDFFFIYKLLTGELERITFWLEFYFSGFFFKKFKK